MTIVRHHGHLVADAYEDGFEDAVSAMGRQIRDGKLGCAEIGHLDGGRGRVDEDKSIGHNDSLGSRRAEQSRGAEAAASISLR